MKLTEIEKADIIATATAMADAGRPIALSYFRGAGQAVENKLRDGFDPVTKADKEIELAFREILAQRRPSDGILGEEFDDVPSKSGLTWVLDPIDGTRAFISGTPTWGVLIAVHDGTQPVFGIVDQPFTGERFSGGFGVSQLAHNGQQRALGVRKCDSLDQAILFTTMPQIGDEHETARFDLVAAECKLTRFGMDCYAYALLAAGQIDLVIEAQLNPFDIQGPLAVIEAAGGIVTNWQGGPADQGGQVVAAGDPRVHAAALEILNA